MELKRLVVIGGLRVDVFMNSDSTPGLGESVLANESLGGRGANMAVAARRSCRDKKSLKSQPGDKIEVRLIGLVGQDEYGNRFESELKKDGIVTDDIVRKPGTCTSICFVMIDSYTRQNRCLFTRGATANWSKEQLTKPSELGSGIWPDLVVVQMEMDRATVEKMIEVAGQGQVELCLKATPASPIAKSTYRHITHFIVNESEAAIMSGRPRDEINKDTWLSVAREFINFGAKNVVITLGAMGAFYATAEESGRCLAYGVDVVDTTGAGDVFTGTYASEYLRQKGNGAWNIRDAVTRANKAAALAVQRIGAQTGIPWADEIDAFSAPPNDEPIRESPFELYLRLDASGNPTGSFKNVPREVEVIMKQ
ncbi:ribokinase [Xylariaceae sp. FL0016]|nr:ribokinase [Xylariaceae sp. FL0016]